MGKSAPTVCLKAFGTIQWATQQGLKECLGMWITTCFSRTRTSTRESSGWLMSRECARRGPTVSFSRRRILWYTQRTSAHMSWGTLSVLYHDICVV
eukprot:65230-Amorphochlora_amoeboformis.AAC.1